MAQRPPTPNERPVHYTDPPTVAPHVTSAVPPAARAAAQTYLDGQRARREAASPRKATLPVAGGPGPSIPRLDSAFDDQAPPMTLEQHAAAQRQPPPGVVVPVGGQGAGSIVEPSSVALGQAVSAGGPPQLDLRPTDLLPPEALRDPTAQRGSGAQFAAAQPHLAAKYGVLRDGRVVPPQQLQSVRTTQLRPDTLQGLAAMSASQKVRAADAEEPETPSGRPAEGGTGSEGVDQNMVDNLMHIDGFQLDRWRRASEADILNTPEQRKLIEGRLKPLTIDAMLERGYIEQVVPIRKGFTLVLRSYDGVSEQSIKRLAMEEAFSLNATERYVLDRLAFYTLVTCLHQVNDKRYPGFLDKDGAFNDSLFLAKAAQIGRLPVHMLASIGLNCHWFELRVRELFKADDLGNG